MAIDISAIQSRVPDAFQQSLSGYGQGLALRDQRDQALAQRAAMEQQSQRRQLIQNAMMELAQKERITNDDFARTLMQFPELGDSLKAPIELLDQSRREATLQKATEVFSAAMSGNVDIAKQLLEEEIAAADDAGDKRGADGMRAQLAAIEANPQAATRVLGMTLAANMPDQFAAIMGKIQEADNARRMGDLDVRKAAADLGLTEAQTKQTLANVEKLSAETQKAALEMEAMKNGVQPIDPEKRFDFEAKLRGEYNKLTSEFHTIQEAYRRVQATDDNAAGDLALIFNYMKMLDPGSVVRETEFANAQNAAGVPDRVRNLYNRIMEGERLNPNQRTQFRGQADRLVKAARTREREVREGLKPVIKSYGLDEVNVFSTTPEVADGDLTGLSDDEILKALRQ